MYEVKHTTKDSKRKPRSIRKRLVDETRLSDSTEAINLFEEAHRIIILLDALGINGVWNRKDPVKVLRTWSVLQDEYTNGIEY